MMNQHALTTQELRSDAAALTQALMAVVAVAGALTVGAYARIPLPFTPVPLTLQTFAIIAAPFFVGRSYAAMGAGLYLALGLAGVPLFTMALGPTFGYIIGFMAAPFAVMAFRRPLAGIIAGSAVILALGAGWLAFWTGGSLTAALMIGVLPFVPGDILKAAAAYAVAKRAA